MELTPRVISRVVHPTAAFVDPYECAPPIGSAPELEEEPVLWPSSSLNPKNRIDSLDEVLNPKWRIDGCTGMGTQFFTLPLFFTGSLKPMRIDTFIPEGEKCPRRLSTLLELGTAFHVKDARVARLGISRHVLRALEYWSSTFEDFEEIYNGLPFGSRIVFENLAVNVQDIKIRFVRTHYLERQLLSCAALQALWDIPTRAWPKVVDISQLELCRQLHESISVVHVSDSQGPQTVVLKALTSHPKFLYHELKILLTLPLHQNIISRPRHIVTKKCRFGGKTAVIGFTMMYHPLGTLRDILPFRRIHKTLRLTDQLRWAIQLTSAFIHIRDHGRYYSDLRLDNILLSETDDLILVDFEQRGVWCGFASPELNYLDYMFMLATDSTIAAAVRDKYAGLLEQCISGYMSLLGDEYHNLEQGFSVPWSALTGSELEAAEVFMLGRVLWCIFEGQSCPELAVWQSYPFESDIEFPMYRNTPRELRDLIGQCTGGKERTASCCDGGVVRRGNNLVLRQGDGTEGPGAVQAEATRWWEGELQEAESFLGKRLENKMNSDGRGLIHRLSLNEALKILEDLQGTLDQSQ